MHRIAAYRLVARDTDAVRPTHRDVAVELIEDWLDDKCAADAYERAPGRAVAFPMNDGREAALEHDAMTGGRCTLDEYDLVQGDGRVRRRTFARVAVEGDRTEVYVELFAVSEDPSVAPGEREGFEAGRPRFVRDLLRARSWSIGEMPLIAKPIPYRGREEGERLARTLRHADRTLPMVLVSLVDGRSVSTSFPAQLADRLAGVAAVATLDEAAAWALTGTMDKPWSCFGGAVRLYWPLRDGDGPRDHPLWTLDRLQGLGATPAIGGRCLADELARRTMAVASRTLTESALLAAVRRDVRKARRDELVRDSETTWTGLAADLEDQLARAKEAGRRLQGRNDRLEAELVDRDNQIAVLRHELGSAVGRGEGVAHEGATLAPETELPPQSVVEAVERARERHDGLLVFGDDVEARVRELAPDAGPPAKVLQCLDALADMAAGLRAGSLGMDAIEWLRERGVDASGYGKRVRNGARERRCRTFHDGTGQRVFLKHAKPNGGTSPERCVRIYYDVSDDGRSVLVGYVGRHLEG